VGQDLLNLRFRDVMPANVRLARLRIDVVTDLHDTPVIERRLTLAISGGAQSARRMLWVQAA
jgi:hypothetical protein